MDCSYLIGKGRKQRKEYYDTFKTTYKLRSDLVHGSIDEISNDDSKLIYGAEDLLKKSIMQEIIQAS